MLILFSIKYAIFKWIAVKICIPKAWEWSRAHVYSENSVYFCCSYLISIQAAFMQTNNGLAGDGRDFAGFLLAKMEMFWFSSSGEINLLKWMNHSALIICSLVLKFKLQLTSASPNSQCPLFNFLGFVIDFHSGHKNGYSTNLPLQRLATTCFEPWRRERQSRFTAHEIASRVMYKKRIVWY